MRRFARATGEEDLHVKNRQRVTLLDDYTDHLHRRWAEGCTDATALAREITTLGYRGSIRSVRTYLHPLRAGRPVPPPGRRHRRCARSPAGCCATQTTSTAASSFASST